MNLDKISPAPWSSVIQAYATMLDENGGFLPTGKFVLARGLEQVAIFDSEADCDHAALARNAFDVMTRRGWGVAVHLDGSVSGARPRCWVVVDEEGNLVTNTSYFDPFTALVAADEWYKANVENK